MSSGTQEIFFQKGFVEISPNFRWAIARQKRAGQSLHCISLQRESAQNILAAILPEKHLCVRKTHGLLSKMRGCGDILVVI